jgi:hypothetical protein
MIITDLKEIYEKVEVGDILVHYSGPDFKEERIQKNVVIEIESCYRCKSKICKKEIHVENWIHYCFHYGLDVYTIKYLIKKEDFITEEEMMI